ncbi:MAG: hypothetical protein KF727_01925 [Microbacteriaceae bacterium]|nr:hypothetical protein [Microbacteriaceae bacterium]
MAATNRNRPRVLVIAVGALLLAVLAIALIVGLIARNDGPTNPGTGSTPSPGGSGPSSSPPAGDGVVDVSVGDRGWVAEPITVDPGRYIRAALEAAGTFDTTLSTRSEWVEWLETWFTPSPLYDDEADALEQMAGYKDELDTSVLLPQADWDDLAAEGGRVEAHVSGAIDYLELPETTEKKVWTGTAQVVLTYSRTAEGQSYSYEDTVRVSVQVVCGGDSVPTPGSAQRPSDCKVVRFFDEAVG